jgi:hypothetical protein
VGKSRLWSGAYRLQHRSEVLWRWLTKQRSKPCLAQHHRVPYNRHIHRSLTPSVRTTHNFTFGPMQQWRDLTPGSGAYVSEGDRMEPNFQWSFYGSHYPRLLKIKQRYDPTNLFYAHTAVPGQSSLRFVLRVANQMRMGVYASMGVLCCIRRRGLIIAQNELSKVNTRPEALQAVFCSNAQDVKHWRQINSMHHIDRLERYADAMQATCIVITSPHIYRYRHRIPRCPLVSHDVLVSERRSARSWLSGHPFSCSSGTRSAA